MLNIGNYKVLIVGTARNCASSLESVLLNLYRVLDSFCSVQSFIVESDSTDASPCILDHLTSHNDSIRSISLGSLASTLKVRTQRLAFCRNLCLQEISSHHGYRDIDLIIVADMDDVNKLLTKESMQSCWGQNKSWDVCTANQLGPYYDIWALRHHQWSPNDCWEQHQFLCDHGVSYYKAAISAVYSKMITINPDSDWIEVQSSFGGLALYRRDVINAGIYQGLTNDLISVCEHVSLNLAITSSGGNMYINPKLINCDTSGRTNLSCLLSKTKFWLRCQLNY